MKTFLLLIVGVVVGGALSLVFSAALFTGVGAAAGIATGLKAGACLTVEAAKDQGFITAEQVDDVLNAAVIQFKNVTDLEGVEQISGGDAECAKMVDELKRAVSEAQ